MSDFHSSSFPVCSKLGRDISILIGFKLTLTWLITKQLADFKDVVNGTMFVKNEHFQCRTKIIRQTSFLASGDFCRLLITFANSLDPDQDQQIVGPDLDPNHLTL